MPYKDWSTDRILQAIEDINEVMKGPMSDLERRAHYLDRKDLRAELERREQNVTTERVLHSSTAR